MCFLFSLNPTDYYFYKMIRRMKSMQMKIIKKMKSNKVMFGAV